MKKFTLLIASFVCAIGFSQTGSLTNWADSNPDQLQTQINTQAEANTPIVLTGNENYLSGEVSYSELENSSTVNRTPITSNRRTLVSNNQRNGGTATFTVLADFQAACSGTLVSENFDGGPGGITACGPIASSAGDGCFPAGELEEGFEITASNGTDVIFIEAGAIGNTSTLMGANTFLESTIITFTGPDDVNSVGMDIWNNSDPDTTYDVYDTGGVLMDSYNLNNPSNTENFYGIMTDYAIGHIEIRGANDSGELFGNFLFGDCSGGSGGGCTAGVFTDRAAFDAEAGALPLEDFDGGPGALSGCGLIIDEVGDGTCFAAGEILPGIQVTSNNAAGGQTVYIHPNDGFGNTIPMVGSNTFTDYTIINFPNGDVNSIGFEVITLLSAGNVDIRIFGTGGLIETQTVATPIPESFWGYISDETIVSIEIEDMTGANVELVGNFAFGECSGGEPGGCDVEEDFEAGLPAGWSTVVNSGSCDFASSSVMSGGTDFPTLAMTYDDDACGDNGENNNISVLSDVYDVSGATAASIGYDYGFVSVGAGDSFTVEVYDGAAWQQVAFYDATVDPTPETFDVLAMANADFQVRWTYDDATSWAWSAGVDNFCLTFDVPAPPTCDESADFEAGLPAGWSTVINTGNCDWMNSSVMAGGTDFPTLAMTFDDDDACGEGQGAPASNVSILSDVYNTNGATTATLGYDYAFVSIGSGDYLEVEVYDGAAWQQVAFYDATVDPTAESMDVLAYANADFQVRWTYDDAADWAWSAGVDNFCLSHDGGGSTGVENDLCGDALPVECGETVSGDTTDATDSDQPGTCDTDLGVAPGVWYTLTIPADGDYNVTADTFGSAYDTKLGVFSGDCGALVCVAGNDDAGGVLQSEVLFVGAAGETYSLYVTGWGGNAGAYDLNVACVIILATSDNTIEGFSFYPNPSSDVINLSSQDNIERVAIYNILGQKVVDQNINATSSQLDVANLVTGTYLMEVSVDGKTATYKVIKN